MGLNYHGAGLVMFARSQGIPLDRVLTLGRLHCPLTPVQVRRLARDHAVDLSASLYPAPDGEVYAEPAFAAMGVKSVESMDMSTYQGCSVCHDLNLPLPPLRPDGSAWGTWDAVFDGGTLEHVFHLPNALASVMKLIRTGGHFFSTAPAESWMGHGFYQFSPEWAYRVFAPENGFEMVRCLLAEYPGPGRMWQVRDPAHTGLRTPAPSRRPLALLVLARKTADVEPFRVMPQQSDYQSRWSGGGPKNESGSHKSALAAWRSRVAKLTPQPVRELSRRFARHRRLRREMALSLTEVHCVQ